MSPPEREARAPIPEGSRPGQRLHLRPIAGFAALLAGLAVASTILLSFGASLRLDSTSPRTTVSIVFAYAFVGIGVTLAVAAFMVLGHLLVAAVRLRDGGRLTVRSWPRWREQHIELTLLRSIDAKPHVELALYGAAGRPDWRFRDYPLRERKTTLLMLTDATGAEVRVNPFFWRHSPSLLDEIRSAASRTGASLTPPARAYLGLAADRDPA